MDNQGNYSPTRGFWFWLILILVAVIVVGAAILNPDSQPPQTYSQPGTIAATRILIQTTVVSKSTPQKTSTPLMKLETIETGTPITPTTSVIALNKQEKIEYLLVFLNSMIEDGRYDRDEQVVHKYIDSLDVTLADRTLTFEVESLPDDPDEFLNLAWDLIKVGAYVSHNSPAGDWNLKKVELVNYGPLESYAKVYVSGHKTIEGLAEGRIELSDVLKTDVHLPEAVKAEPSIPVVEPTFLNNESRSNTINLPGPEAQPAACTCVSNSYNCKDFSTQHAAQVCYAYCLNAVGYDVHWLDDDKDGAACEWNP